MSKFLTTVKKFPRTFWIANTMELFERWAWYGLFMVLALYLTKSTDEGALGFTQVQKGAIMGTVTAILYFLPIFTGSLSDKFGFKRTLVLAYLILATGYYMMGTFTSYGAVYAAFLYVAVGAALFKPVISATIAKTTDETTSSIGFGVFYMMINIGGFLGPLFSSKLRDAYGWKIVFIMSAVAIVINLVLVLLFYKEPFREENKDSVLQSIIKAFKNIVEALKDFKLTLFLIIMIGFWTIFNQLYYTLPNFIDQWVDTGRLYDWMHGISPALASAIGNAELGVVNPEMLQNVDAFMIIFFQLVISSIAMRFKPINAIITGIGITSIGVVITFLTGNPFYTVLGIMIFSIGEMSASPKFSEYIGRIAPREKAGLYMGTSFLPIAAGNYFAGLFAGPVYQSMSDKISLLKAEVANRGLTIPEISPEFTQNDYITKATELMHMSEPELTRFLWDSYNPSQIWWLFAVIGLITIVSMFLYDKFLLKSK